MIGLIQGKVDTLTSSFAIIDTGNVGYKVLLPLSLLSKIHAGQTVKFYTYSHVREDAFDLFGFESYADQSLFELFLGVSGIGPKTALGIFSIGTAAQIRNAVITSDVSFFEKVPRLGRKNAQKILIELGSKIGDSTIQFDVKTEAEEREIVVALKEFGFKTDEISQALKETRDLAHTPEERVKLALKHLGK